MNWGEKFLSSSLTSKCSFAKTSVPTICESSRVRQDLLKRSERDNLLKYRIATGMAMTAGMIMVLPSSHRFKQWGRLCQNDSWGETPVRRLCKLPLSDFPSGLNTTAHTGCRGQMVCLHIWQHSNNRKMKWFIKSCFDCFAVRLYISTPSGEALSIR